MSPNLANNHLWLLLLLCHPIRWVASSIWPNWKVCWKRCSKWRYRDIWGVRRGFSSIPGSDLSTEVVTLCQRVQQGPMRCLVMKANSILSPCFISVERTLKLRGMVDETVVESDLLLSSSSPPPLPPQGTSFKEAKSFKAASPILLHCLWPHRLPVCVCVCACVCVCVRACVCVCVQRYSLEQTVSLFVGIVFILNGFCCRRVSASYDWNSVPPY